MRIGLIAPPWVPVPPPAYGGTEVVVDNLARGLSVAGHGVELFTVGESTCAVCRHYLYDHAIAEMGDGASEAAHVLAAYDQLQDVDLIHDHTVLGALVARARRRPIPPVVVTNHGPFNLEVRRILGEVAGWADVVAISHAQARTAGDIPIAAVIQHGIDLSVYTPGPGGGGYLAFIGRMSPDKGVHRAVRIARRAGLPLKIVTKMRSPAEHDYFARFVEPLMEPGDEPPAELTVPERVEMLRHAEALINPIRWSEPFGLVMVEALACGTPVLAFPYGSAPEIVDSGRTGFLCSTEADMARAVKRLGDIDRRACRAAAEARFDMDRMVEDHIALYRRILGDGSSARAPRPGSSAGSSERLTG